MPLTPPVPTDNRGAVCRTYLLPGETTDRKRYMLMSALVMSGIMWWLMPLLGAFVADPMIQLILSDLNVSERRRQDGSLGGGQEGGVVDMCVLP